MGTGTFRRLRVLLQLPTFKNQLMVFLDFLLDPGVENHFFFIQHPNSPELVLVTYLPSTSRFERLFGSGCWVLRLGSLQMQLVVLLVVLLVVQGRAVMCGWRCT